MKTSNKILLALFLLPFVVVTLVAFTFYSTYKSGKYSTQEEYEKEKEFLKITPSFNAINLSSYNGRITIKSSDSFAIAVFEWDKDKVTPKVKDGVLTLLSKNRNDYAPVTILCPSVSSITVDTAEVSVGKVLKNTIITANAESNIFIDGDAENLSLNIKQGGTINTVEATIQKLQLNIANGGRLIANESNIISFGDILLGDSAILEMKGRVLKTIMSPQKNSK